ncbi:MAG: YIP1 family protein [Chloracidobacterium sp.]|nr:YIP1 family protein [Chloracidobacterium sp.]
MNRLAGIIVAAAGFLLAILSITGVVAGLTQTGIVLILFGGLVIGLSFIDKPEADDSERMSTPASLANMFVSPTEVFRNLRRHPRWLVALLIMSILSTTFTGLFMYRLTPERVANFAIDKTLEMSFLNDDARRQIEAGRGEAIADAKDPIKRAGQAVSGFAAAAFGYAFLAVVFMLFAMALGGKINFWQAFSAAVYAAFPFSVLKFLLNTLILFLKDPSDIHPILGQSTLIQDNLNFLVLPSQHPVIYTLLSSLSLFGMYWIWLNATGQANAGEKVTSNMGWTASISLYLMLVLFGVTMAALFPSFMS